MTVEKPTASVVNRNEFFSQVKNSPPRKASVSVSSVPGDGGPYWFVR